VTRLQCRAASPQEKAEAKGVSLMPDGCPYPGEECGQNGESVQSLGTGTRPLSDLCRTLHTWIIPWGF